MERLPTGSKVLDAALAGGIPDGSCLFVSGEEGAGATEFALTLLRSAATKQGRKARIVTALRSPARVHAELEMLFDEKTASRVEVRGLKASDSNEAKRVLEDMGKGDVLVIESAATLAIPGDGIGLMPFWLHVGNAAQAQGVVVILLSAPGTLSKSVEAGLAEGADGVLRFTWHDGGPTKRRRLSIFKLRGLAPVLDGDEVPVFDVSLQRGVGFSVSHEKSVV